MACLLICNKIIDEIDRKIPMTLDEKKAIKDSLWALAVATKPGNGQYAGYLRHLVEEDRITTATGIFMQLGRWNDNKAAASEVVSEWFFGKWLKEQN